MVLEASARRKEKTMPFFFSSLRRVDNSTRPGGGQSARAEIRLDLIAKARPNSCVSVALRRPPSTL